jgi:hypothetical protein
MKDSFLGLYYKNVLLQMIFLENLLFGDTNENGCQGSRLKVYGYINPARCRMRNRFKVKFKPLP